MGGVTGVELAAIVATVLAAAGAVPQLRRIAATGDLRGVSLACATLGVASELAWAVYAVHGRLWSAVPEAILMTATNVLLVIACGRAGAVCRGAVLAGIGWATSLAAAAAVGGTEAVAALLGLAYAVQVAPSIWTAYRTDKPSGLAAATWALVGVESLLWGVYGFAHDDPAITGFAVVGLLASTAILLRKLVTRSRELGVERLIDASGRDSSQMSRQDPPSSAAAVAIT